MDLLLKTKIILKCLLISSRKYLTIDELNNDYSRSEGHNIPFNSLGFANLKDFLMSISDILSINNSGTIVPVTSDGRSQHIHKLVTASECSYGSINYFRGYQRPHPKIKLDYSSWDVKDEDLFKKMITLKLSPCEKTTVHQKDEGESLTMDDVSKPFGITKNDTMIIPLGENMEETKVISILDDEQAKELKSNDDGMRVTDATATGRDELLEAIPQLNDDEINIIEMIELPMLDVGAKIPDSNLTGIKSRRTYNIVVTEINRPWRFWFSVSSDKTDIEIMEYQLKCYYKERQIVLDDSEMIVGGACVVFHKRKWLRAEFIERPVNGEIKVCFVDYGTIDVVATSECLYINHHFSSIPKWCYAGALEFIEPIDDRNIEVKLTHHFCNMVKNKPLVGFMKTVDQENHIVRMILIDVSNEDEDVVVNRELMAIRKSYYST